MKRVVIHWEKDMEVLIGPGLFYVAVSRATKSEFIMLDFKPTREGFSSLCGGPKKTNTTRRYGRKPAAARPPSKFKRAEDECKRLRELAREQQKDREMRADGRRFRFGSKEDFAERMHWFVDACRSRAEGGRVEERVRQKVLAVLEGWCESFAGVRNMRVEYAPATVRRGRSTNR